MSSPLTPTAPHGDAATDGRRLRILICLQFYHPHRTGLTIHVQHIAEALVRRGHQVTVLSAHFRDDRCRCRCFSGGFGFGCRL